MRKQMIGLALVVASVVFFSAGSITANTIAPQGETFTHSDAGVKFTLPKGWKAKPDGAVITVSSADDALQIVFWVPEEDTFEAAVKELDNELGKTIKNIKVSGKPTEDTHNGMPHFEESGTGEVDGVNIVWSVDVLGAKKPLIILTFAAPNLFESNAAGYGQLVNSIKRVS